MRIKLSDQKKEEITGELIRFFHDEFDETLSEFRAREIVEFMLLHIGPSQYNQGISDARSFLTEKLDDLDTEFHELEEH